MKNKHSKNNKSDRNVFFDAVLSICDVKHLPVWLCGILLFSGAVVAFNSTYDAVVNKKSDDLKLVEAVATDTPYYEYTELNNRIIYSASLPVDIDGDGERDLLVELVKDKKFKEIEKEPLLNIRKGDKLVLEGFVVGGGKKLMKPVVNKNEILEGDILSGDKNGGKTLTSRNIITIEDNLVNMPKNRDNLYKIAYLLNQRNYSF